MSTAAGDDDIATSTMFELFARYVGRDGGPLYQRICEGAARDAAVCALLEVTPLGQRRPNLLLASVHYLLLGGVDDPLAAYYPTVAEWRDEQHLGQAPDPQRIFSHFASFCRAHREELVVLLTSRATQTNEVGRCAAFLPAFAHLAAEHGQTLAICDLGTSAGLNLFFDRYAYDYGAAGHAGAADSAVQLHCEVRHGSLGDLAVPEVTWRAGIDRQPIRVADEEASLWLLACQWPDHLDRFRRTRGAIEIARSALPVVLVEGDLVDGVADLAAGAPPAAHLCITHSWVAAYLSAGRQTELAEQVTSIAAHRPLSWLYAEQPFEVPALPMPPAPGGEHVSAASALVLHELGPGRPLGPGRRLADLHAHGRWLHWWGAAAPT